MCISNPLPTEPREIALACGLCQRQLERPFIYYFCPHGGHANVHFDIDKFFEVINLGLADAQAICKFSGHFRENAGPSADQHKFCFCCGTSL